MAVEIKELVFRAVVRADERSDAQEKPASEASSVDRDALVRAAVKEVLRIMKASKER